MPRESDNNRGLAASRLAERQHTVVSLEQLRALGFTARAVQWRCERGQFHRKHKGVYAVGHRRLTIRGHFMAAVLACGPEAALSHHAAAALWGLRPNPQGRIDVTAPGNHTHRGVRCHVSADVERTVRDGIPVTTLSRTLLDYAEAALPRQLQAALEQAERLQILDFRALQAVIAAHPGRRGLKPLRRAMAAMEPDPPWLQSEPERAFRDLLRAAGDIPLPRTNVLVEGELVDCVWPEHRLVVEIDSYGFHRSRRQFEDDRRRDLKLASLGWRVVRITDKQIAERPHAVLAQIRRLLAAADG